MFTLTTDQGNHSPLSWAYGTAQIILDLNGLTPERVAAGRLLREDAVDILTGLYDLVIERERDQLAQYHDQCDNPYQIDAVAEHALRAIQDAAIATPWQDYVHGEWSQAAEATIATHLSTAIHVERLLFADAHPENDSATAYKAQFR